MQAARGTPLTPDQAAGTQLSSDPPARRRRTLLVAVAVAAYALDVVSKVLAVHFLTGREDVPVLGSWFSLSLTRNPGAAFSTGTEFTYALSALALVAIGVVLYVARRVATRGWAVALGLLLGGVAGNFTDRLLRAPGPMLGHVVDFMRLPHWPIFNVADICIDVGAALIVLLSLRGVGVDGRRADSERGAE
jgi:signal peptidase II